MDSVAEEEKKTLPACLPALRNRKIGVTTCTVPTPVRCPALSSKYRPAVAHTRTAFFFFPANTLFAALRPFFFLANTLFTAFWRPHRVPFLLGYYFVLSERAILASAGTLLSRRERGTIQRSKRLTECAAFQSAYICLPSPLGKSCRQAGKLLAPGSRSPRALPRSVCQLTQRPGQAGRRCIVRAMGS